MTGRRVALIGAWLGLAVAGALAVRLLVVQPWPRDAAMAAAYLAPFLASLAAVGVSRGEIRASLWLAAAIVAAGLSFTSLAGATLPLLIPAGLLVVGGARTLREARERATAVRR